MSEPVGTLNRGTKRPASRQEFGIGYTDGVLFVPLRP